MNTRRIIPIFLTALAHLVLLQFFSGTRFTSPIPNIVVPVTLHEIPVITKFTAPPPKATPQKKIQPLPPHPKAPVEIEPISQSPEPAESTESAAPMAEPAATELSVAAPIPETIPAPVAQTAPALSTLPPPSASYILDVVRTEPNVANPYYGSGEIRWEHDDKSYTMQMEVGVNLLFTTIRLYSLQSEGELAETGIKPRTVTETRRGRSATATHFNYDSNTISFSASTAMLPLSDGAQDKATVLMQLASIGNADPSQFQAGKNITIQVAEEKEASPYQFVVVEQETIDTKLGHLLTWHIVRPPRPGLYSSRLDIWIAPDLHWLPVQIRNSEANGAITTQTIRKIITGSKQ
ncbi:DUF3108 domain-containing protein [Solimicrobium silvestre]|uniref:DUF3108 domain-containing protein n=1 Tax=Solimicrobium silvestre TaxID=2099400 RepID=A0A2S9H255_9BURK|nr:DUF3108 domain-containing protein [Solimicrobium silvestre]PRC94023.1 hypothetical protein S2091_1196 [Solimicrobium silvestre]